MAKLSKLLGMSVIIDPVTENINVVEGFGGDTAAENVVAGGI